MNLKWNGQCRLESEEFVHLFCSVGYKDLVARRLMSYTPFESIEDIIESLFEVIENLSTDIKVTYTSFLHFCFPFSGSS